ncbi:helix-turn-helix domain-containing protein [Azotobacter vinelandii]|uniref:helix-turn-helix domain-containing protein n=2 Tax=Azotobacter vinelandii TaxID=354 RepID=UPI002665BC1B|nr:helix-turn-helix domain-containing protein [Azotobacter vinelandii]WKN20841.1 helix-turn-helix domain-containing protein [Azotobacter vinelandii]
MSTIIMSVCWPLQDMTPAQKAVLISLADNANDEGVCWPSIARIAERTCLSERAVRNALRWLEEVQLLTSHQRQGRSTWYTVTPAAYAPGSICPPASNAPTPAPAAPQPRHELPPTPAPAAPRTVIEPSLEPKENRQPVAQAAEADRITPAAGAGPDLFNSFWKLYPRKQDKAKAQKAWAKLKVTPELFALIVAGLSAQVASADWLKDDGRYVPMPTTWLNGRRWEDEVKPASNVHQFPQSRHTGFDQRDYTAGLTMREDGTYAF